MQGLSEKTTVNSTVNVADYVDSELQSSPTTSSSMEKGGVSTITALLSRWGIETQGIEPVLAEERTDTRLYQMFFVWFSSNMNILGFSTGSSAPAFFGLGIRESLLIILVVDIIFCAIPAYFAVFGPKLGTRTMVQARFSWGYYGAIVPSIFNVFSLQGFLILNCIIGGQTLASVSDHLNDTLGIIIIGVISLVVTFCGYQVVHWYESVAWIPNVIAFIVMLAVGAKRVTLAPSSSPTTVATVLSFGTATLASSVLSWCTMTADYGVYHSPKASSLRVFTYTYLGFLTASLTGHMIGAAFTAAAPSVPSWQAGLGNGNDVGGLISAVLAPTGGFGKFLVVLIALSIPSACAPTMYSFGTSFMAVAPFFSKVPRYVFAIVSEAILIPIAIVGATHFYTTFVDVMSLIGYWSAAFAAIILVEHFVFRRNDFARYDITQWDRRQGCAAVLAFFSGIGIIVPCMSQAFYEGPIARTGTGDIGILTGFAVSAAVYLVLRPLEKRVLEGRWVW